MSEIYWTSGTHDYTLFKVIDSNDYNEPYETGYRKLQIPFPNHHPDDEKFKGIHQKMFSDGPKLKFVASGKFVGSLYWYIFQMGPNGLGYYIDPLVMRHVYGRN